MNTIHPNAIKLNLNKFVGIFMFLVHVRDYKDTHIYKKGTYKLKKEYDLIGWTLWFGDQGIKIIPSDEMGIFWILRKL